jgi:hypothetical protein
LVVRVSRHHPSTRHPLGWHLALDEWTHGTQPEDRAVWRGDQRRSEVLHW